MSALFICACNKFDMSVAWRSPTGVKLWVATANLCLVCLVIYIYIYIYIYAVIYIFSIITQVITDKLRYSVVERKNTDQNAKVMETITLKDGSKKYNATLMFIGKLSKVSHATW